MGGALGFLVIRLIRARRAARGPAADRRLWDVRRGLVPVRLAGDRRGADGRGVGIAGSRLPLVLVPGLLAAGIGSLVSTGLGSWTGVNTSNIAIGTVHAAGLRPTRARRLRLDDPARRGDRDRDLRDLHDRPPHRPDRVRPAVPGVAGRGLAVAGLAILFAQTTGHRSTRCCSRARRPSHRSSPTRRRSRPGRSGVIGCKGLAYAISLGSSAADRSSRRFTRHGGRPAGRRAARLLDDAGGRRRHRRGDGRRPAAAADGGRARDLLGPQPAFGAAPLVIVGVVVAYMVTIALPSPTPAEPPRRRPPDQSEISARLIVPTSTIPRRPRR